MNITKGYKGKQKVEYNDLQIIQIIQNCKNMLDENKIENYRKELKENILKTLTTRIVNSVGEIKVIFNEKQQLK